MLCLMLALLCLSAISASAQDGQTAPKWAVGLAVAAPIADGVSTVYAMRQPGVGEGNPFYHTLFGPDVTGGQVMAFKVGQAAVMGVVVHQVGKRSRKGAMALAVVSAGINFGVSALNYRTAQQAKGMR